MHCPWSTVDQKGLQVELLQYCIKGYDSLIIKGTLNNIVHFKYFQIKKDLK